MAKQELGKPGGPSLCRATDCGEDVFTLVLPSTACPRLVALSGLTLVAPPLGVPITW